MENAAVCGAWQLPSFFPDSILIVHRGLPHNLFDALHMAIYTSATLRDVSRNFTKTGLKLKVYRKIIKKHLWLCSAHRVPTQSTTEICSPPKKKQSQVKLRHEDLSKSVGPGWVCTARVHFHKTRRAPLTLPASCFQDRARQASPKASPKARHALTASLRALRASLRTPRASPGSPRTVRALRTLRTLRTVSRPGARPRGRAPCHVALLHARRYDQVVDQV